MTASKPFWQSKTVWVSAVTAVLGILSLPDVRVFVPPEWTPYLLALAGVLGVVLRLATTQPLTVGGAPTAPPPPQE